MEFYRVKPEFDQTPTNRSILVGNEIYTKKEIENLRQSNGSYFGIECFEREEISKQKTCWFFGARFENT